MAAMGGLDCLVFTGGIGENSTVVREMTCRNMAGLGIILDKGKNKSTQRDISAIHATESRIQILVVPTDEELEIATQTLQVINSNS